MNKVRYVAVLLSVALGVVLSQSLHKYDIFVDKIDHMKNDKLFTYDSLRITKYNSTTPIIKGEFDMLMDFDDSIKAVVKIYIYKGNEYRILLTKNVENICTKMLNDTMFKPLAKVKTNFPMDGPCPVAAGRYKIWDAVVLNEQLPLEPPGNFDQGKAVVEFYNKDNVLISASYWNAMVIEKDLVTKGPSIG